MRSPAHRDLHPRPCHGKNAKRVLVIKRLFWFRTKQEEAKASLPGPTLSTTRCWLRSQSLPLNQNIIPPALLPGTGLQAPGRINHGPLHPGKKTKETLVADETYNGYNVQRVTAAGERLHHVRSDPGLSMYTSILRGVILVTMHVVRSDPRHCRQPSLVFNLSRLKAVRNRDYLSEATTGGVKTSAPDIDLIFTVLRQFGSSNLRLFRIFVRTQIVRENKEKRALVKPSSSPRSS